MHFNPRAPCGARRGLVRFLPRGFRSISILAPLAGRDQVSGYNLFLTYEFQSSRPLRGATALFCAIVYASAISILAPLAGRDFPFFVLFPPPLLFQSSRPLRGATYAVNAQFLGSDISILAPLAGRDGLL